MKKKMNRASRVAMSIFSLILVVLVVRGDEAVELTGKRHVGQLLRVDGAWAFQVDAKKIIPATQLSYVRFTTKPAPAATAPLDKTILMSGGQRLTGSLLRIDDKTFDFVTSWEK